MNLSTKKKLEEYEIVDTLNFRVSFRHDFYIQKSKFPVFKIYQNFPNSLNKYDDNLLVKNTATLPSRANVVGTRESAFKISKQN